MITRRGFTGGLVVLAVLLGGGCGSSTPSGSDIDEVRAELMGYVGLVTAADGYRYRAADDQGHEMATVKIIQVGPAEFAAVYFWLSEDLGGYVVSLATSTNLLDWTWQVDLATYASQPYIAAASDGGWVVAWEQEPPSQDESQLRMALYPDWDALLAATPTKEFTAERQLSECAEGTPNIYAASSTEVVFGFHFFADCLTDRQGLGTTDWRTWTAESQPLLDRAAAFQGYRGSIGDRDYIEYGDHGFTFLEAQLVQSDWYTFRVLLYDEGLGAADRETWDEFPGSPWPPPSEHVFIATHRGSSSFTNLTVTQVEFEGRPTLVMGLFIPSEGSQGDEAGQLIYYRFVDEG